MRSDDALINDWVAGYASGTALQADMSKTLQTVYTKGVVLGKDSMTSQHVHPGRVITQRTRSSMAAMHVINNDIYLFSISDENSDTMNAGSRVIEAAAKYVNCRVCSNKTVLTGQISARNAIDTWISRLHVTVTRSSVPIMSRMSTLHPDNLNALRDVFALPFDTLYITDTVKQLKEKLDLAKARIILGAIE